MMDVKCFLDVGLFWEFHICVACVTQYGE